MTRIILIISALFSAYAYAELPDTLKDPATKEVAEYLDAKVTSASNADNIQVVVSTSASATSITATCPVNTRLLACGGIGFPSAPNRFFGCSPSNGPGAYLWGTDCKCQSNGAGEMAAYATCVRSR